MLYQLIQPKMARRASAPVANTRRCRHSRFNDSQNDSAALSQQTSVHPTESVIWWAHVEAKPSHTTADSSNTC